MLGELDRAEIARRLPHAGSMSLLDRVLTCNESGIRCSATSHQDPDNPLRGERGLDALAGIEYAAQAAALHGSLLHETATPRNGALAAVKNVVIAKEWLSDAGDELLIDATLLHGDPAGGIFSFAVHAVNGAAKGVANSGETTILIGQFTLMFVDNIPRSPS
ncbi:MAG: hydroxymyristoyl-ACP dehydratase [Betaproteobacteria bacterium]